MRVEETCRCGARITVVGVTSRSQMMQADEERSMWSQIDRWRRLHKGCRPGRAYVAASDNNQEGEQRV